MTMRQLACAFLVTFAVTGCGGNDDPPDRRPSTSASSPTATATGTASPTATPGQEQTQTLAIYLMHGEKVMPVPRQVSETPAVATASLVELMKGPTAEEKAAGFSTAIPEGTELNGVSVIDGVANVQLSNRFTSGGGSASMQARVAQVVHTLTRFETVKAVSFSVDGKLVKSLGGEGVVVDPPVDRADFEDLAPQILVESPLRGAAVSAPLRISGTANTFEATLQYQLLAGGRAIAKGFVTATSGSGTRGTFDAHVDFEAEPGTKLELYAYESSAEDGSPQHEVRIPLVAR